jgi:XapX domain-containing protein
VNSAYGGWVATALRSDSRVAGGIKMKVLFLSFIVGLGVGILYGLIRVKSPAPPIVALLGLLGMVLGEQFGERYDSQLYNPPSRKTRYDLSSIFTEHIATTNVVDKNDIHRR